MLVLTLSLVLRAGLLSEDAPRAARLVEQPAAPRKVESMSRVELQKAYDDVVAQLRTAYTITYSSDANATHRRLRVRTNREGASVRLSPAISAPR